MCPSVGIWEDSLARLVKQVGTVGPGLTPGRLWHTSEPASGYYTSNIPWGQVRWFSRPGCKVLKGGLFLSDRVKLRPGSTLTYVQPRVSLNIEHSLGPFSSRLNLGCSNWMRLLLEWTQFNMGMKLLHDFKWKDEIENMGGWKYECIWPYDCNWRYGQTGLFCWPITNRYF